MPTTSEWIEALESSTSDETLRIFSRIPRDERTEEVCLTAVKRNGLALTMIDPKKRTEEILLAAVKQNGYALSFVAPEKQTEAMRLEAVIQDGDALQDIPAKEQTIDVCLAAVLQDAKALEYVSDHHREAIIDSLSPAYLLAADYACIRYFSNREKYEGEINAFLSKIKYVVVRRDDGTHHHDDEIRDIQTVYAQKHPGKTVCMSIEDENDKNELDHLLTTLQNNRSPIHLALTGHANPTARELAGMTVTDIVNACENHPNITHIHLVGCRTAQALPPQQEKEMSQSLAEKIRKKEQKKYGFQTMLNAPVNDAEFEKKCADFCEKNKLDGVYVVSKEGNDTYRLIAMKISNDGKMVEKISDIPENRREKVTTVLKMKKPLVFQKDILTYRDQQSPMQPNEVTAVRALAYEHDRFDPRHPKYETDKKTYPFLAKIPAAITDLQESLLKKLANKIEKNLDIKHEITIEGFTQALHVDAPTQQLLASRTHLYPSTGYTSALFGQGESIINREKLNQERREDINATKKENSELEGASKARTLLVKTRRKG